MASKTTIGKLVVELLFDSKQFNRGLGNARGSLNQLGAHMGKVADVINNVVIRAFQGLTLAVGAFVTASASVGVKFEAQMARVAAITNSTDNEFKQLTTQARELGRTTEFTATQAAGALEELAKAGSTVQEAIESSNAALLLAGTSQVRLADATQVIVSAQRQFGLEAKDSTRIVDVYSKAMRSSLLDFSSLREAMKFAGTAGASFGMSLEETVASVAAFRDIGLEGSLAGTNLRMALTQAAKGSSKAAGALAEMGLTLADINPETNSFAQILEKTGKAGISATQAVAVFGTRAGANMAALAKQTAEGKINIQAFAESLQSSGGETAAMYERIAQTVSYQAKLALSALQEISLSMYDAFSGPLQELLRLLPPLFNDIAAGVQGAAADISGDLSNAVKRFAAFIQVNRRQIVNTFVDIGKAVAQVTIFFVDLLPLVDDFIILVGTAFVAQKVFTYALAIEKVIRSLIAARTAMAAFGATAAISTGGLTALAGALAVVVTGLAYYVSNMSRAAISTRDLKAAQDELAKKQDEVRATQRAAIKENLDAQQKEVSAFIQANGDLDKATKERLLSVLDMTTEQVRLGEKRGEIVQAEIAGMQVYQSTQDALASSGGSLAESIQDEIEARENNAVAVQEQINRYDRLLESTQNANSYFVNPQLDQLNKDYKTNAKNLADIETLRDDLINLQDAELLRAKGLRTSIAKYAAGQQALNDAKALEARLNGDVTESLSEELTQRRQLAEKREEMQASLLGSISKIGASEREIRLAAHQQKLQDIQALIEEENELYEDGSAEQREAFAKGDQLRLLEIARFNKEKAELAAAAAEEARAARQKEAEDEAADRQRAERRTSNIMARMEREFMDAEQRAIQDRNEFMKNAAFTSAEQRARAEEMWQHRVERAARAVAKARAEAVLGFLSEVASAPGKMLSTMFEPFIDTLSEAFPAAFGSMVDTINGIVMPALKGLLKTLEAIGMTIFKKLAKSEWFKKLADAITGAAEEGEGAFARFLRTAIDGMGVLGDTVGGVAQGMMGLGKGLMNIFSSLTNMDLNFGDLAKGAAQATVDAREEDPNADPAEAARTFVDELIDNALAFVTALADSLPALIERLGTELPVLIDQVIASIPRIVDAIVTEAPALITALAESIGPLTQAVSASIPPLIDILVEYLPVIVRELAASTIVLVDAILSELPTILDALTEGVIIIIDSLPDLLEKVFEALPDIITSILGNLGKIVNAIVGIIPKIVKAFAKNLTPIVLGLARGLVDFIIQLIGDDAIMIAIELTQALMFQLLPALITLPGKMLEQFITELWPKLREAAKEFWKQLKAAFSGDGNLFEGASGQKLKRTFGDLLTGGMATALRDAGLVQTKATVAAGAYSGINYVPATMRMTLHKGEAVVPAHRNAQTQDYMKGPAPSGQPVTSTASGGGSRVVEVALIAEGRLLNAIQVRADERGQTRTQVTSTASGGGSRFQEGFSRGDYNPYGS